MKVYIGPYKKYYSLYIAKTSDNMIIDNIINIWNKIVCEKLPFNDWVNKLNTIRPEREISVEIDDYDVWNLDSTLALIITPALKVLKKNKQGAPLVDDDDVPDHLKSTNARPKEHEYDTDEFWFDRFEYVLDEMIFAFDSINNDWEAQYHHGDIDWTFEESDNTGFSKIKVNKDNYSFDEEGYKEQYERIKNGLRLFSKYYFTLWD
jgi:hypothetical protein